MAAISRRLRFWVDIIAWLPFDYVIVEAIWPPCYVSNTARYVSLLKLLRLVRVDLLDCQQPLCTHIMQVCRRPQQQECCAAAVLSADVCMMLYLFSVVRYSCVCIACCCSSECWSTIWWCRCSPPRWCATSCTSSTPHTGQVRHWLRHPVHLASVCPLQHTILHSCLRSPPDVHLLSDT
jgi:hypothetical protein